MNTNLDIDPLELYVFKWDILQLENQRVSALWWTHYQTSW